MKFDPVVFAVFLGLTVLVTGIGFFASRWRRAEIDSLDEWALGGRTFGPFITWFLLGGDLYSAYALIAIPAAVFSLGAFGFYAVPNQVVLYALGFLLMPRLVAVAHKNGYVTLTDYVNARFSSRKLGLAITLTGLLATLPYLALQVVGLEVVFGSLGLGGDSAAGWFIRDLPLIVAFGVLAAYTYSSGLRAAALIAFIKDALTYIVVIAAVIIIPIKLGGYNHIFSDAGAALAAKSKTPVSGEPAIAANAQIYLTLALGSGLAFFLYPHAITGVLASRGARTVRRNMSLLPLYTILSGFVALLGFMALAAHIKPLNGNPQYAVPQLLQQMFPSWFFGVALAAIGMSALVPAAIMAIAAGNLVSRNIYREFVNKNVTSRTETTISKVVSVLTKLGALVFVLTLDTQFALNFQLLGGIWILQTLPTITLGLFTRRFTNSKALLSGWGAGIVYGTYSAYQVSSSATAHFGGSTARPFFLGSPVYIAISALLLNAVVTFIVALASRSAAGPGSVDEACETRATEVAGPAPARTDQLVAALPAGNLQPES